jgi:hypothetical protein
MSAEFTAVKARKPPRERAALRIHEKPSGARSTTVPLSAYIPVSVVERIDNLIEKGFFENRSDFIREAVRRLLIEYEKTFFREPQPVPGVR